MPKKIGSDGSVFAVCQESAVKTDYLKFTVQSLAYLRLGFKAKMNAVWFQTKEDICTGNQLTWHWKVTFIYRR